MQKFQEDISLDNKYRIRGSKDPISAHDVATKQYVDKKIANIDLPTGSGEQGPPGPQGEQGIQGEQGPPGTAPTNTVQVCGITLGITSQEIYTNFPRNAYVFAVIVEIITPYTVGAEILINIYADSVGVANLMSAAENDAQTAGIYKKDLDEKIDYAGTLVIKADISGSPVGGTGNVFIFYTISLT